MILIRGGEAKQKSAVALDTEPLRPGANATEIPLHTPGCTIRACAKRRFRPLVHQGRRDCRQTSRNKQPISVTARHGSRPEDNKQF